MMENYSQDSRGHNLTLGERVHAALVKSAEAKVAALKARKLADRVYDRLLIDAQGKNSGEREARARTDARYVSVDDAAIEAESAHILVKADADGLAIVFEQWRTNSATARAEMSLR